MGCPADLSFLFLSSRAAASRSASKARRPRRRQRRRDVLGIVPASSAPRSRSASSMKAPSRVARSSSTSSTRPAFWTRPPSSMRWRVRSRRALAQSRMSVRAFWASSLWRWVAARRSRRAVACRSRSRVTSPVPLSPGALLSVAAKERGTAFGPPRDGFGLFPGLLDGREQHAGQGFQGQGIGAGCQHQLAELGLCRSFNDLALSWSALIWASRSAGLRMRLPPVAG